MPDSNASFTVNQLVDAVFVLSVRSFTDRIAHIRNELARHRIDFEWVFEYDVDALTPELVDSVFAPSDLKPGHQSLVLKHIETWKRCVDRGYRRVLVFEDDAVLARDFERVFARAMNEADGLAEPYMIYLGCGDNKYVTDARSSGRELVVPDIELPATDATVLDHRAAQRRLQYVAERKVTRPADWLMREADAQMGVRHWWLKTPIVEQGSMNGRFSSVLDDRRTDRGLTFNRWRFRWDKLRRRTFGATRPEAARADFGDQRARVRRDFWAISTARAGATIALIGTLVTPTLANAGAALMLIALATAPSARARFRAALEQPLGVATLALLVFLALAMTWSVAPIRAAFNDWTGWRHLLLVILGLAVFDSRDAKVRLATTFVIAAALGALFSYYAFVRGFAIGPPELLPGIVMRNHVTQGIGLSVAAFLAAVLGFLAPDRSLRRWIMFGCFLLLVSNVVFVSYGRSGHLVLSVLAIGGVFGLLRGRARIATLIAVVAIGAGVVAVSPVIKDRFIEGWKEVQQAGQSEAITSMGMRVVMWETTAALIRERPLLGYGLGGFPVAYREMTGKINEGWRARPTQDPHGQFLFIVTETGLVGLAIFVFWLVSAFRQPVRGPFRIVGLALLVSWCVTSVFSSHFQTFNEGHLIALALGIFLAREDAIQVASAPTAAVSTSS